MRVAMELSLESTLARACQIMVVLTKKDSLLVGKRFYVENELVRLMAGAALK